MSPRMEYFLTEAAKCEPGKGMPFSKEWSRIAHSATRKGYGWILSSVFAVFIINDAGRAALRAREVTP